MSSYVIYNSSDLDYVEVEVKINVTDYFLDIEPYTYLTVMKYFCVIFEIFISV